MSDIGVLGGTFDPIHYGHLSIAKAALEEFHLSKVIILPTKVQPFKLGRETAEGFHRVNMAKVATASSKEYVVSSFEASSEEISYTYKTLCSLQEEYKGDRLHFILGTDSFLTLDTWYMGEKLLQEFSFIVGIRPGYKESETKAKLIEFREKYNANISLLHNDILEISSTEIKNYIKLGKNIEKMVPITVARYINEHGLYK